MNAKDQLLCCVYLAISAVALIATWSNNIAFFQLPNNGGVLGFIRNAYANPAASSIANDILFFALAAFIFMASEARRLQIRFVWLYLLLSCLIAVSVVLPLFLIARQQKLSQQP